MMHVSRASYSRKRSRTECSPIGDFYDLSASRSGEPTLRVTGSDGQAVQIHSGYRPVEEAERQLSGFDPTDADAVVVFGLGLGYHVAELLERCGDRPVLVIEAMPQLSDAAASCAAGRLVLSRCQVLYGPDVAQLTADLRQALAGHLGGELLLYRHAASCQAQPKFYATVAGELEDFWREGSAALGGLARWRELRRSNVAGNLGRYLNLPGINGLFGACPGSTLFVVGAGPSLNKNLGLLSRVGRRGLVIAVDTALGPLQRSGVTPHLVVSTDPQPTNTAYLHGVSGEWPVLAVSPECFPLAFDCGLRTLVFQTDHPLLAYLGRYAPRGRVDVGCCAAHAVFNLGLALGAEQVVLIGLDLALTDGADYCRGLRGRVNTYRAEERIPGYFGDTVSTDRALMVARTHLERRIAAVGLPVQNGSEGGARIGGAEPVKLREAIHRLPRREYPIGELLRNALARKPTIGSNLGRGMGRLLSSLREIRSETAGGSSNGLLERLRGLDPAFSLLAEECLPELGACGHDRSAREVVARDTFARAAENWAALLEDSQEEIDRFICADHLPAERLTQ